jgi:hypothetical protein
MKPGTIFISHRAEYGSLVRELKKAIETKHRAGRSRPSSPKTCPALKSGDQPLRPIWSTPRAFFSFTAQLTKIGPGVSMRRDTSPASMPPKNNLAAFIASPGPMFHLRAP